MEITSAIDGKRFNIDLDLILAQDQENSAILDLANYGWINPRIRKRQNKLFTVTSNCYMGVWIPRTVIDLRTVKAETYNMQCKIGTRLFKGFPGNIIELACYETSFAQKMGKTNVVAPGEIVVSQSIPCVATRGFQGSKLRLYLSSVDHPRKSSYGFLTVFKEVE
jgi:hypothetical protein